MSFMGADCSTSSNPLSQFQKHVQGESSLQRDRLGQRPGGEELTGGFRNSPAPAAHDEALHGFLQGPADALPMGLHLDPNQVLHNPALHHQHQHSPLPMGPASLHTPAPLLNAQEFTQFQQQQHHPQQASASSSAQQPITQSLVPPPATAQTSLHQPMMGMGMGMGMMGMGLTGPSPYLQSPAFYQSQQFQQQPQQQQQPATDVKGKGVAMDHLKEEQWEDAFKAIDLQDQSDVAEQKDAEAETAGKQADGETNHGDFEAIWKGIQAEQQASRSKEQEDALEEWANMDFGNFAGDWSRYSIADPVVEEYLFEEANFFTDKASAYDEGLRIMRDGGNLSLAALAFEAAVQQNPQHVDAWVYLGQVQAQNEKETAAIRAMDQALRLDPNNLTALMGLAVSYVNEGYEATAYRTLERWLSAKYPQIVPPGSLHAPADVGFTERNELHEQVTKAFVRAAMLSPDGEHMDPDVQVGLGVLFYGNSDYTKAIDCFRAALNSVELHNSAQKDQVYLLWNRLGATLANSGRAEDAIVAYQHALQLRPNFVRARYNLGVSCINMNCLEEAAQHFLQALSMHKSLESEGRHMAQQILSEGSGPGGAGDLSEAQLRTVMGAHHNSSTTLYDTLRRTFTQMGRRDLAEQVVTGVDPAVFEGKF